MKRRKKFCSLLMCFALIAAMLPSTVLADEEESAAQTDEAVGAVEEGVMSADEFVSEAGETLEVVGTSEDGETIDPGYDADVTGGGIMILMMH